MEHNDSSGSSIVNKRSSGKKSQSSGGPLAEKLLRSSQRLKREKTVDLASYNAAKRYAEERQNSVPTAQELSVLQPSHALYVYAQSQMSVFSDLMSELPEMSPFVELLERAESIYAPSGPPMSPVTQSFFWSWWQFDACVGKSRETMGQIITTFGRRSEVDGTLIGLFDSSLSLKPIEVINTTSFSLKGFPISQNHDPMRRAIYEKGASCGQRRSQTQK